MSSPKSAPPEGQAPARASFALRRGLGASVAALLVLVLAAAPARVAGALRVPGGVIAASLWAAAGVLRDLSAIYLGLAPAIAALALVLPRVAARLDTARFQRAGLAVVSVPFALAIWLFGITAHEFKAERGAYPTSFDLAEGASSSTFLQGALGFFRYDAYWAPALVFGAAASLVLAFVLVPGSRAPVAPWRGYIAGVVLGFVLAGVGLGLFVAATSAPNSRFGESVVGDPFRVIRESSLDLLVHKGPSTPRDLVRDAGLPDARIAEGAALVGWPPPRERVAGGPCVRHAHERPLDRASEPPFADPRGSELLRAFEGMSASLMSEGEPGLLVWQLALESFRADDLHALNPQAPREIDPFVNGLYEAAARGGEGVIASRAMYQAGVRTAQGLGALTCGVGTLPYNLSIIRDLEPFAIRGASDVLHDAGFRASFFYGSDASFDGMRAFFTAHGFGDIESQAELPKGLPTGAWGAVTDTALFDEATTRVAESVARDPSPRFIFVMSLSNHSPYTAPADLPAEVTARVDHALATTENHAVRDDHARIVTHAYTDASLARFFARLDTLHLAERSIVVVSADHSTGEAYVWGTDLNEPESDDAKAKIPFLIVLPQPLLARARARDAAGLDRALRDAQRAMDEGPLSQNDVPALLLALLKSHPAVRALPASQRWHTLGGEVTSPWFRPIAQPGAYVVGINGVSELFALDRAGKRVAPYEASVFLKTRGDRYVVTPSLVPVTATLASVLRSPPLPCGAPAD